MADSQLLTRIENSLAAIITTADVGTENIYVGTNYEDKAAPCVICVASEAGEDDPPGSGNKWVNAQVVVKYIAAVDADGTVPDNSTLQGNVADAINTNTLADDISSNATGLTCFGAIFDGSNSEISADCWVDTIRLRLYCCPKDFAS